MNQDGVVVMVRLWLELIINVDAKPGSNEFRAPDVQII
jgi:hypothetical protein